MVRNIVTLISFLAFTAAIMPSAEAVKPKFTPTKNENQREENLNPPTIVKKAGKKRVKRSLLRNRGAKLHGVDFDARLNQGVPMPQVEIDSSETE